MSLRSFIWHFLKPYRSVVFIYVGLAMLAGFWGPTNSWLVKHMIDSLSLSPPGDVSSLTWPAILLVTSFFVCDNITWRSIKYLNYKYQAVIKNRIISETFDFVLSASHQFFQDNLSGRIANQINILADNIEQILHEIAQDFIRGAMLLIIALASMYYVNPIFFLILSSWFVVFFSFSLYLSKRLIYLSDIHAAAESTIAGELVDSISNASNIRIFASRPVEVSRLKHSMLEVKRKFQNKELCLIALNFMQGTFIAIMLGFMLYSLIRLRGMELISVGDFALILGLSFEVAYITWSTMAQVDRFNQALGKSKQSLAYLWVPHEVKDHEEALRLQVSGGQIAFENVKFHYRGTLPLFQNKSIVIGAGQKVGLVGYSGSGKTTFVNLILRLYDVNEGQILIDGQDISKVTGDSLRKNIAMIPQDPSLFHRTLMENIRYGRMNASDQEVIKAAHQAHAHEFIVQQPNQYLSLVGERGVKLSGGQRQRIAIARAILKDAPILILDEATSQLDSITEGNIQSALWHLMQGKTTIVIAHRLSTLLNMDRILVFDQGKIVEDGSHALLLAKNGLYKKLWDAQVGGFLPEKEN
jgi:ATP-binding cassette subfamily B protein